MRSILIPHIFEKSHQLDCDICKDLGYLSMESISIKKILESINFSISSVVVFPCLWHRSNELEYLLKEIGALGKKVKFLFSFKYWESVPIEVKEQIQLKDIGLVYTSLDELNYMDIRFDNYFLIKRKSWSFNKWESLNAHIKNKCNFFFASNVFNESEYFSPEEAFEIQEKMRNSDDKVNFSYPFDHDALDIRNPDHRFWNLVPNYSKISKSFDQCFPVISIIIPFCNRTRLLLKTLNSLVNQSLSKLLFEVILVDDGSETSQVELLQLFESEFSSLSYMYIYVERNIKLNALYVGNRAGPIRNLGVSQSRANLLLFLDSDILLPENYLKLIVNESDTYDVTLPRRVYLNKSVSELGVIDTAKISADNIFITPWQGYLDNFHKNDKWSEEELPWKFFITYALSIKRHKFYEAGGFRSNYISFGYEDLDLGYRVLKLNPTLKLLHQEVFHLYHFDGPDSEYTLNMLFRKFQLAMTSRVFVIQNMPPRAYYLKDMISLSKFHHVIIFQSYKAFWRLGLQKLFFKPIK